MNESDLLSRRATVALLSSIATAGCSNDTLLGSGKPDLWLRNYGDSSHTLSVTVGRGNREVASKRATLAAYSEGDYKTEFDDVFRQAGTYEVAASTADGLSDERTFEVDRETGDFAVDVTDEGELRLRLVGRF